MAKSRLASVDALRGSAALAVVLHHAVNYGNSLPSGSAWFTASHAVLDQGYLGVPLFFVISGYCIHLRWAKQQAEGARDSSVDFLGFWKRRLHRLYPPYFVALCLSMGLVVAAYALGKVVPLVTLYPQPRLRWMALDFLAHVGMLHGFHPLLDKAGGNPPFWTLAREECFYLMYFGLLAARRWWGMGAAFAAVFVLGIAFPLLMIPLLDRDSAWWSVVNSSAIVLWTQWCFGMVAVEAYYGLIKLPSWCYWGWLIPVWSGAAFASAIYCPRVTPSLWGAAFFTLLNCCVRSEGLSRWPKLRVVSWLSRVGIFSYSLYLVHNPVRGVAKQLLGSVADTLDPRLYILVSAFMAILGYYAGKIFFNVVERRFLNAKPRTRTQAPAELPHGSLFSEPDGESAPQGVSA